MTPRLLALVLLGLAVGCDAGSDSYAGDTDVFGDDMPDDLPAGNCGEGNDNEECDTEGDSAGVVSTSGDAAADCLSDGCVGEGVCAADWDPESETRGEFACRFACVPLLDDTAWCSNDASCCDAMARCTERGYCVLDDDDGSTGGDSSGGDSSGGDESGGDESSSGGESTGTTTGGGA